MQILRKLNRTKGGSCILFVPQRWVENLEKIKGQKISKIQMSINGEIICQAVFEDGTCLTRKDYPWWFWE